MRPGRAWSVLTNTRNQPNVPSVNTYTMPAPSSRESGTKCVSGNVNSSPPSAGPVMLASWKMAPPHVTALTKCFSGTRWGISAELAGPENARPVPTKNSTE